MFLLIFFSILKSCSVNNLEIFFLRFLLPSNVLLPLIKFFKMFKLFIETESIPFFLEIINGELLNIVLCLTFVKIFLSFDISPRAR